MENLSGLKKQIEKLIEIYGDDFHVTVLNDYGDVAEAGLEIEKININGKEVLLINEREG